MIQVVEKYGAKCNKKIMQLLFGFIYTNKFHSYNSSPLLEILEAVA